jgi:hypothetical protein
MCSGDEPTKDGPYEQCSLCLQYMHEASFAEDKLCCLCVNKAALYDITKRERDMLVEAATEAARQCKLQAEDMKLDVAVFRLGLIMGRLQAALSYCIDETKSNDKEPS